METYKYQVVINVEVSAFSEGDAWDMIQDTFGVGEELGIKVNDCEYREIK